MATGGESDDLFLFSGQLGQLTVTLVNPYSGEIIYIDEEKNINNGVYYGGGGDDTIVFTNRGDAIFIANNQGEQVVHDVENFFAGDGGDVIDLAHGTYTLGNVVIVGGAGNDILWSNVGQDQIYGSSGNDLIDGGPGNDWLEGESDNDIVNGGAGHDYVFGGSGHDILYGGNRVNPVVHDKEISDNVVFPHLMEGVNIVNLVPPGTPALGIANNNLHVDYQATATLTFRDGFAGYNNSLGVYTIADDGTIQMGSILWANTKTAGIDVAHTITLPVGADGGDIGFFIIANGDNVNNYAGLDLDNPGNIKFIYDYGLSTQRTANIHDDGSHVKMVYDDGSIVRVLNGPAYHTTERGGDTSINADGAEHVVSGLVDVGQHDVLRIGFEDLPNLGDADYEDVFFDLNFDEVITQGDTEDGNDVLVGGAGNDTLYGQDGKDILVVGQGIDEIYGGRDSDQFVFDVLDAMVDTIHDFKVGGNGDVLNITDILQGYDPMSDMIADFVKLTNLNGDTQVYINADGDHGGNYMMMAIMTGVETTLADLINNGNLVANHHVEV